MTKRTVVLIYLAVAMVATVMISCSDDEWGDIFRWPPVEREVANGALTVVDGRVVMYLWGSNYDMGFAHGQLMGRQIVRLINDYLIEESAKGKYQEYYDSVGTNFLWPTGYEQELQGIIEGMDADGVDRWLEAAGRELDVTDLKVWNAFADWAAPFGQEFGCWGRSSEGGFPLAARNFYVYSDPQGLGQYMWAIIVYYSDAGAQFLSVAPPGFIGVLTGASGKDVAVFANGAVDSDAQGGAPGGVPMALLLRDFLATAGPGSSSPDLYLLNMVSNNTNFGVWNLFGASLNQAEELPNGGEFGWVVECDSKNAAIRYFFDNENPEPPEPDDTLFATSSFRRLYPPAEPDTEYNNLVGVFTAYNDSGNNPIGLDDAMGILDAVSATDNACSVIFGYDPERKLVFAVAVSDGVTPAAKTSDFTKFRFHYFWLP